MSGQTDGEKEAPNTPSDAEAPPHADPEAAGSLDEGRHADVMLMATMLPLGPSTPMPHAVLRRTRPEKSRRDQNRRKLAARTTRWIGRAWPPYNGATHRRR